MTAVMKRFLFALLPLLLFAGITNAQVDDATPQKVVVEDLEGMAQDQGDVIVIRAEDLAERNWVMTLDKAEDDPSVTVAPVSESGRTLLAQADPVDDEPVDDPVPAPDPDPSGEDPNGFELLWLFIVSHWAELLLAFLGFVEVIVRLTPTEKDNAWFNWIKQIIDALVPNRSKYGGTHKTA
jgi:hypothetical protein